MQLEPHGAGAHLLFQGLCEAGVALAEEAQVHGQGVGGLQHTVDVPGPRGAGGGIGAGGGAGAAAEHGGDPGHQGLFHLLGADEMDVGVDGAGGDDAPLAGDGLGARANDDVHPGLHVRVAGLADPGDAPVLDADVGLDDAPVVQDQGVGDDQIGHVGAAALALAHAVADHLAAAELDLVPVDGTVRLDLDPELRVRQADPVAGGGAIHLRIGLSADLRHAQSSSGPITWALKP